MMSTQAITDEDHELEQVFKRLADEFDKLEDYEEILGFNDRLQKELKSEESIGRYNEWSAERYTQRCRLATVANLSRRVLRFNLMHANWNKRDPEFENTLSALTFPGYLPNGGIFGLGSMEDFWVMLQFKLGAIVPRTADSQTRKNYGLTDIQPDHMLYLRYKNLDDSDAAPLFFVPLGT